MIMGYFSTRCFFRKASISVFLKRTFFSSLTYFKPPELMRRSIVAIETLKRSATSFLVKRSGPCMARFYPKNGPEKRLDMIRFNMLRYAT
jgi:glutathione peroxidase-family protein